MRCRATQSSLLSSEDPMPRAWTHQHVIPAGDLISPLHTILWWVTYRAAMAGRRPSSFSRRLHRASCPASLRRRQFKPASRQQRLQNGHDLLSDHWRRPTHGPAVLPESQVGAGTFLQDCVSSWASGAVCPCSLRFRKIEDVLDKIWVRNINHE